MILLLLLILGLSSKIEAGCPSKCRCGKNSVTCVSKNLQQVPYFESLSNSPVIIDLSGNSIPIIELDDFSFDTSDQVKEIFLNRSELITIEEKAFEELENLQELYLGDNFLNSLPEHFIATLENMILLDISSNYFSEMPRITSKSLEVLAIANSGVSMIADDALAGLPNLRFLLLQQNNLKHINTGIFDFVGNLFFVRLAYNPWYCNCTTVELFDYLTQKQFVDITEPVQCQNEKLIFIDIYNEKGVAPAFKDQCHLIANFSQKNEEIQDYPEEEEWEIEVMLDDISPLDDSHHNVVLPINEGSLEIDEIYYSSFYYSLILSTSIVISLVLGAICGSCVTYKLLAGHMRQTESCKQLLTKSEGNFA